MSLSFGEGPPILPVESPSKKKQRTQAKKDSTSKSDKDRVLAPLPQIRIPPYRPPSSLQGSDTLIASELPDGFPPELAFRALAAYSLIRTLSCELRLSPFTPNVFLRALYLPYPNGLMGDIHVALLRILIPTLNMGYNYRPRGGAGVAVITKKRRVDGARLQLRAGDNLTYLDGLTWPLFYDDYVNLTADVLWEQWNRSDRLVDLRSTAMQPRVDSSSPPTSRRGGRSKTIKQQESLDNDDDGSDSAADADSGSEYDMSDNEDDSDEDFVRARPARKSSSNGKNRRDSAGRVKSNVKEPKSRKRASEAPSQNPTYTGGSANDGQLHSHPEKRSRVTPPSSTSVVPFAKGLGPGTTRQIAPVIVSVSANPGLPLDTTGSSSQMAQHHQRQQACPPATNAASYAKVKSVAVPSLTLPFRNETGQGACSNVHDLIQDFVAGRIRRPVDSDGTQESQSAHARGPMLADHSETSDMECSAAYAVQDWSQFEPMKKMRGGTPYHMLEVADKLNVLEFLLDELLTVDVIAAEFSRREAVTAVYDFPYGALPSKQELDDLENKDDCRVCNLEGDLLCCDGCVSSYHLECIGISSRHNLSEGKWLCPECRVPDPANFGPLHGDRKGSLDWFTASDLQAAERFKSQQNSDGSPSDLESPHQAERVLEDSNPWVGTNLLVVNGFVFSNMNMKSSEGPRSKAIEIKHDTGSLLPRRDLYGMLQAAGPILGSMWPLSQVPLSPTEIWTVDNEDRDEYYNRYFISPASYDPAVYASDYRNVPPLSFPSKAGAARAKELLLASYESQCCNSGARNISKFLTREATYDSQLANCLRTTASLFDPYGTIAMYLGSLEGRLRKSCLLSENWNTVKGKCVANHWSLRMKASRSIRRLAQLAVQLVDATHPRAFVDEWRAAPGSRINQEFDDYIDGRYIPLPENWSKEDELKRGRLTSCLPSNINEWLRRESMRLSGSGDSLCFVQDDRSPLLTGKRKVGKQQASSLQSSRPEEVTTNDSLAHGGSTGMNESLEPASLTDGNEPAKASMNGATDTSTRSRRSGRSSRSRSSPSGMRTMDLPENEIYTMEDLMRADQTTKLDQLRSFFALPFEKEAFWPVAGRTLFGPSGCLPPVEMRRLARNAGAVTAPFVTYDTVHEVGQGAACYIWRKKTLQSRSLEELLLQLRVLQSFLDNTAISSCETLARKSPHVRANMGKEIRCTQRNLATGMLQYFVVDKILQRGCWVSCLSIELAPLVALRVKDNVACKDAVHAPARQPSTSMQPTVQAPISTSVDYPSFDNHGYTPSLLGLQPSYRVPQSTFQRSGREDDMLNQISQAQAEVKRVILEHEFDVEKLLREAKQWGNEHLQEDALMRLREAHAESLKKACRQLEQCGVSAKSDDLSIRSRLIEGEMAAAKNAQRERSASGAESARATSIDEHSRFMNYYPATVQAVPPPSRVASTHYHHAHNSGPWWYASSTTPAYRREWQEQPTQYVPPPYGGQPSRTAGPHSYEYALYHQGGPPPYSQQHPSYSQGNHIYQAEDQRMPPFYPHSQRDHSQGQHGNSQEDEQRQSF